MGWIRITRGKGSVKELTPFPGCGKAEIFARNARKRCSRWICATRRPELWPQERIAAECQGCEYWQDG
ncbi:MAG: hypothetical protein AUJ75_03940 [Candidatus Omnitrophica bacterium CG1_02_49_10]|nr:MAG: hypothetical protein AUJ75_03940 [Candidatus Omnitrophica bacterium CG1_02_49_10]